MIGPHVQFELIHHSLHEFEINMFIFVSLSRYLFVLHFITKCYRFSPSYRIKIGLIYIIPYKLVLELAKRYHGVCMDILRSKPQEMQLRSGVQQDCICCKLQYKIIREIENVSCVLQLFVNPFEQERTNHVALKVTNILHQIL